LIPNETPIIASRVINLKTAKAIALAISESFPLIADSDLMSGCALVLHPPAAQLSGRSW